MLGLLVMTQRSSADEKEPDPKKVKAAQEAIRKLLESKYVKKDAEAVAKGHALDAVMWSVFKPRKRGGFGVGNKPEAIQPDGIELKINKMGKTPMLPADLARELPELIKMVEVVKLAGEVSAHQCNVTKKVGEKDPRKWKDFNSDMLKYSDDLLAALKGANSGPAEVRAKSLKLYGTCTGCHGIFRD
jgi:cytochrome c556